MEYNEFLRGLKTIRDGGFVKTHRMGDTGIGKTLEDLLGIVENNIAGPDFDIYELKSGRKVSSSMLSLFTKAPQPKGANPLLLDVFGYKHRKKLKALEELSTKIDSKIEISLSEKTKIHIKEKELHVTVDSLGYNSVGLKLELRGKTLFLANDKDVNVYYEEDYLRNAFENKYRHKLIYVMADTRRVRGQPEEFWYNEAYLLEGFDFDSFSALVNNGVVKLDIRIGHYRDGRPHDHGTGFRVFPKYLPRCFKLVKPITL